MYEIFSSDTPLGCSPMYFIPELSKKSDEKIPKDLRIRLCVVPQDTDS